MSVPVWSIAAAPPRQVDDCKKKLVRAEKLIGGLGGERQRWSEAAQSLAEQQQNVLGDVLIAAGFISYLGSSPCPSGRA